MKRVLSSFIVLFFLIIFFQIPSYRVEAIGNVDWLLVKENELGKEWLDLGSIKRIDNSKLNVLSKFYEKPSETKKRGETSLYLMTINCFNKEFRDISKNGIHNFNSKWQTSENDELIDSLISRSCSEVS